MTREDSYGDRSMAQRSSIVGPAMTPPPQRPYSTPQSPAQQAVMREATDWFVRLGAPSVSASEREEFEQWRRRSPAHEEAFCDVQALWGEGELDAAVRHVKDSLTAKTCQPPRRPAHPIWAWGAAAAALAAVSLGWLVQADLRIWWEADVRTATAEQRTIELPDHSTVLLNTDSAIAIDYRGETRLVRLLRGEALFTVQPNPDRPFLVRSGSAVARAVGTAFVVRARGEEALVTVTQGLVDLSADQGRSVPVRLTGGQQAVSDGTTIGPVRTVDLSIATAWARGQLVFVRTALVDVLEELNRYYPGYVWLWPAEAGHVPVTGIYKISDPSRIPWILAESLHLKLTRLSDRLVVLY